MTQKLPDDGKGYVKILDQKKVRVGQFRCDPKVISWVDKQAEQQNRSRSNMIEHLLWAACEADKMMDPLPDDLP